MSLGDGAVIADSGDTLAAMRAWYSSIALTYVALEPDGATTKRLIAVATAHTGTFIAV